MGPITVVILRPFLLESAISFGAFTEINTEARWMSTTTRFYSPREEAIGVNAYVRFDDPLLLLDRISEKSIGIAIRLVKD